MKYTSLLNFAILWTLLGGWIRHADCSGDPEGSTDDWISLFDGISLEGWINETVADWKVADGTITVTGEGKLGLLRTASTFSDYALRVEFKASEDANSGIFLRTTGAPPNVTEAAYEFNIAPADNPYPTGSLVHRAKVEGDYTSPGWTSAEILVLGNTVQATLNGTAVLNYTDQYPGTNPGFVALQVNLGTVSFKNIFVKPFEATANQEDEGASQSPSGEEPAAESSREQAQPAEEATEGAAEEAARQMLQVGVEPTEAPAEEDGAASEAAAAGAGPKLTRSNAFKKGEDFQAPEVDADPPADVKEEESAAGEAPAAAGGGPKLTRSNAFKKGEDFRAAEAEAEDVKEEAAQRGGEESPPEAAGGKGSREAPAAGGGSASSRADAMAEKREKLAKAGRQREVKVSPRRRGGSRPGRDGEL